VSADCRQLASREIGTGWARPRKPMIISLMSLPNTYFTHASRRRLYAPQDLGYNGMQRNTLGNSAAPFYIHPAVHFMPWDSGMTVRNELLSLLFSLSLFLSRLRMNKSKVNKITAGKIKIFTGHSLHFLTSVFY